LQETPPPERPDFWGTIMVSETKGADFKTIPRIRELAWNAYRRVLEETRAKIPFDYRPFQEHMVFDTARREHISFGKSGMSVPIEAQAAFFSVTIPHIK
jgi:hypothetical protein